MNHGLKRETSTVQQTHEIVTSPELKHHIFWEVLNKKGMTNYRFDTKEEALEWLNSYYVEQDGFTDEEEYDLE